MPVENARGVFLAGSVKYETTPKSVKMPLADTFICTRDPSAAGESAGLRDAAAAVREENTSTSTLLRPAFEDVLGKIALGGVGNNRSDAIS